MNENTVKFKNYSVIIFWFAFGLSKACLFMAFWTQIHTGTLLYLASLTTSFFSILIYNEYRLLNKSEIESEEQDAVRKSAGASQDLFDESDEALMLASRSLKNWRRYILPTLILIYGITAIIFLIFKWSEWRLQTPVDSSSKMAAAACVGALGVCYFLLAAFFGGASRQQGGMLLRPFSAWSYLNAILCAVLVAVLLLGDKSYPHLDYYVNRVVLVVFIFLSFELSVNFLIDWYRPRFHKEEKSILESRFLAVFTDSGSIASNIAHALDYQFGLKVTEAGFYRFFKKSLVPLLLIQLVTLYLLSCFTLIEVGQRGIQETFGKINQKEELGPGLYTTLPYPFSKIHVFPADRIMSVEVGQKPKRDAGQEPPPEEGEDAVTVTEDIILWSKSGHHAEGMEEIKYVISNKAISNKGKAISEYNMITVIVPVHFKIKQHKEGEVSPLYKFMFEHVDAKAMLKSAASEVIVKYLCQSDYFEFLGENRVKSSKALKDLVQTAANKLGLGVEIIMIALEATHPPGEVAKAYDDVMAAEYDRDTAEYKARVESVRTIAQARLIADQLVSEAKGRTALVEYEGKQVPMKKAIALEKIKRLEAQLQGYEAQPYLFSLINYLDLIEAKLANTQKIIIDSNMAKYNFQFDLKPKLVPDIDDLQNALNKEK